MRMGDGIGRNRDRQKRLQVGSDIKKMGLEYFFVCYFLRSSQSLSKLVFYCGNSRSKKLSVVRQT